MGAPELFNLRKWDEHLGASGIDEMFLAARGIPDCIRLEIGQPDLPTPQRVIEAAKRAIDEHKIKYTASIGMIPLREAFCEKLVKENDMTGGVEVENVAITTGAMQGLFYTMFATLDPGDEVLIPDPVYPQYEQQARLVGAKPVRIPTTLEEGFKLLPSKIEEKITPGKTRILVLNYPTNPTGTTFSKSELQEIIKVCEEHNLLILSDEVYERVVFGGQKHISVRTLARNPDSVVTVFSFSKTFAMTGWRLGAAVASKELINRFSIIADNDINCPGAVSQYAALAALECGAEVEEMRKIYEKRTMLAYKLLNEHERIDVLKPEGAFYVFPRIQGLKDSWEFCMRLLREKHVATIPGSAFGKMGEGFVRVSCANSEEKIREGITRLKELVDDMDFKSGDYSSSSQLKDVSK